MSDADSICTSCEKPVEYRDIVGYPGYRVGSDGSIWTCWKNGTGRKPYQSTEWKRLIPGAGHNGYRTIGLTAGGKRRTLAVHRLVLEAFSGPCPDGMQACHGPDPSPLNNFATNLRWDTPSANNKDKELQGTHQIGEKNPRAKLQEADIITIRNRRNAGESAKVIAKDYGVTDTLVRLIYQRKCWKHVA